MSPRHTTLASGRWGTLSLLEQLGHVGSDVSRALLWREKDATLFDQAIDRSLELLDLTIADARWRGRLKELTRMRETLCDAVLGGHEYGSTLAECDADFFHCAAVARSSLARATKSG